MSLFEVTCFQQLHTYAHCKVSYLSDHCAPPPRYYLSAAFVGIPGDRDSGIVIKSSEDRLTRRANLPKAFSISRSTWQAIFKAKYFETKFLRQNLTITCNGQRIFKIGIIIRSLLLGVPPRKRKIYTFWEVMAKVFENFRFRLKVQIIFKVQIIAVISQYSGFHQQCFLYSIG